LHKENNTKKLLDCEEANYLGISVRIKVFAIESTIPKTKAHKKLSIVKPGTSWLTKIINKAFNTNVKTPRVKILIGRVKIISIGFKNALIIPKIKATTKEVVKLATWTPGIMYAMLKITIALTTQLINISILI
jgi:hypothetical protein